MPTIAITLPARLSRTLAGTLRHTPDARDVDQARTEARALAYEAARKARRKDPTALIETVEIYSCKRYGGSLLNVIDLPAFFD